MVTLTDNLLDTFRNSIEDSVFVIKETTSVRGANNRSNLEQAMIAGRELTNIKDQLAHGEWLKWLTQNVDYLGYGALSQSKVRAAQYDMALWKGMAAHQDRLVEMGLISDLDSDDSDVVGTLEDASVTVAMSAFYELTRSGVPATAVDILLEDIASGKYQDSDFGRPEAKRLAEFSKAVENLPNPEHRDTAKKLYKQGLTDPNVVGMIPKLSDNNPEIIEEMVTSGAVTVPHQEEQMLVSSISTTDIKLAIQDDETEKALQHIGKNRGIVEDVQAERKRGFVRVGVFEGTPAQVMAQVDEVTMGQDGKLMRVVCYFQEELSQSD